MTPNAHLFEMGASASRHIPVMAEEVMDWLSPQAGMVVVDGTVGGGGHTRLLADRVGPNGTVIAIDRDPLAIERAEVAFQGLPVVLSQADYQDLPLVLAALQIKHVDGVVLDLGLSSDQMADSARGFSFDSSGPLDLRFDPQQGEPAWKLIHRASQSQLANWIYEYGEERFSRRIARMIVDKRREAPIRTAKELAEIVRRCVPRERNLRRRKLDPATRTFQAMRIVVNQELRSLETALEVIPDCLHRGGKAAIISFHSLEDRRVKHAFQQDWRWETLTKKPIRPSEAEIAQNPRSRSAKLRVARRE